MDVDYNHMLFQVWCISHHIPYHHDTDECQRTFDCLVILPECKSTWKVLDDWGDLKEPFDLRVLLSKVYLAVKHIQDYPEFVEERDLSMARIQDNLERIECHFAIYRWKTIMTDMNCHTHYFMIELERWVREVEDTILKPAKATFLKEKGFGDELSDKDFVEQLCMRGERVIIQNPESVYSCWTKLQGICDNYHEHQSYSRRAVVETLLQHRHPEQRHYTRQSFLFLGSTMPQVRYEMFADLKFTVNQCDLEEWIRKLNLAEANDIMLQEDDSDTEDSGFLAFN